MNNYFQTKDKIMVAQKRKDKITELQLIDKQIDLPNIIVTLIKKKLFFKFLCTI